MNDSIRKLLKDFVKVDKRKIAYRGNTPYVNMPKFHVKEEYEIYSNADGVLVLVPVKE